MTLLFARCAVALCLLASSAQAAWHSVAQVSVTAAASGCSQATTFLARTSGLDAGHTTMYTTLICGLVTDGVYSGFDALYFHATQDTTTAQLDLSASANNIVLAGSPVFTADRGYGTQGTGTAPFLDTAGTQCVQNSGSIGIWRGSSGSGAGFNAGSGGTGATSRLLVNSASSGNNSTARPFSTASFSVASPSPFSGLYVGNRSSAASREFYINAVSVASDTAASAAGRGVAPAATYQPSEQTAAWFLGRSFSASEQTAIYNRLNTALTAVGGQ